MSDETLKAPHKPCGSCPYRKDVPSGVWAAEEYAKLPGYDGQMHEQHPGIFMCHMQDGCLCGGWLKTHGPDNLFALRLAHRLHRTPVDPAVWTYAEDTDTEVFASGREAADHGLADLDAPGDEACRRVDGLTKHQANLKKGKDQ